MPAPVARLARPSAGCAASSFSTPAKAELDKARIALPVATRGYNCAQVDALLEELSATLARWDDEGAEPE
ncbi:DivIVA domain-containing protein [Micromonospora sp. NPDC052213]|uniref:DivIVA domain-containing protein n=1 Tax=Micromonospora sp. NPDC052213 TaxID=3155812 RepID=UPI0034120033